MDIDYETIVMDGVQYKHKLDDLNYVFDNEDNKVGELMDDEILWDSEQDETNHRLRMDEDDDTTDEDDDTDDFDEPYIRIIE